MGHEYRGRRAGDGGHGVVLGDPESVVAELFGGPGHSGGLVQRLRRRGAGRHCREVENGKGNHASFTLWSGSLLCGVGGDNASFVTDMHDRVLFSTGTRR
jgi:hypothetical protein